MERNGKRIFGKILASVVCYAAACFSVPASAQEIRVSARLDTGTIVLGDQTILRLRADMPAGSRLDFPQLTDTVSAKIPVVEAVGTDTLRNEPDRWTVTQVYTITSFDAGMQIIPALKFTSGDSTLQTEPLPLQVLSVEVDTTKAIYDIKQPLEVGYGWLDRLRDHLWWIVISAAAVLLLVIVWRYLKKRKKKEVTVRPAETVPEVLPHVLALEKLHELRNRKLWQQGQVKRYHSEISDILRAFLESRYGISAMEQTTDEILATLKPAEIPEQNRTRLMQVLMLADLVKFAKEQPLPADNEQSMDRAFVFVEEAAG